MALPVYNMRQLLEAGVHFGHQTHRWNPKMATYIFGSRNNIHIIDLAQTVPLLHQALLTVSEVVARGGRVLFVGTKRQASDMVAESAKRCAQYFINHRWLGGTLTNWKTISHSIKRLRSLEELLAGEAQGLTKKERLQLTREQEKLERALGGIKDMGGIPDLLFVIDTNKESIAIAEAKKLNIPVIAVVDSNSDPDAINFPIPGNDDAGRAIALYCDLIARAALDGIERGQTDAGIDVGAAAEPVEAVLAGDEGEEEKPVKNGKDKKPEADEPVKPATEKKAKKADSGKGDEAKGFTPLKKPKGDPDDLKQITGVGPVLEKKLNEYGIYHYWQISELNAEDIAKIDEALSFKGRIERDEWLAQAKKLQEA